MQLKTQKCHKRNNYKCRQIQVYRIGASTHALVAASSCEQNKMQS